MSACKNCGAELPEGARICPVCTYPVETKTQPATAAPQAPPPASPEVTTPYAGPAQAQQMQPPGQSAQPTGAAPQVLVRTTEGKAIGALICGILGFIACPLVLSIVAVILARQAQKSIKESGGLKEGEGMATAGLVLGIIGIVYGALLVIMFVAVFGTIFGSMSGSF